MAGLFHSVSYTGNAEPPVDDEPVTGLDFQGNAATPAPMFVFNAAISGTAPPPAYPMTYIWDCLTHAQTQYFTMLFHADYPVFDVGKEYYGCHPYPNGIDSGSVWEISCDGEDIVGAAVVHEAWRKQVVIAGADRLIRYFWNWPNLADVVTHQAAANTPVANPAIIVGDAPWNRGNETMFGPMRGFQYYARALTIGSHPTIGGGEVAAEIATPGGLYVPWYLNRNPTPSDISDKSGNGHHPAWVGADRPLLWEEEP